MRFSIEANVTHKITIKQSYLELTAGGAYLLHLGKRMERKRGRKVSGQCPGYTVQNVGRQSELV